MYIVCTDLEGIYVPEIWINVAEKTGIAELRLTTRDISDYDVLMKRRIQILKEHKLTIYDIQEVIASMNPLDGALDFLNRLRDQVPVIIVSDTYTQFVGPLIEKLGRPTLFCHHLTIGSNGMILGYNLRQTDGKRKTVAALKTLNYTTIAIGDSYNDITMLKEADKGILFKPPQNVIDEYPQFPVTENYAQLKKVIDQELEKTR